jgi:ATP-dependent RNA helicase DeaD
MSDVTQESATLTFEDFDLSEEIKSGIQAAGFKIPSPIQAQAIPAVLEGRDIVAQAHTGTGKTAAFGLPSMSMMDMSRGVSLLVIAPTRELATQVSDELYRLGSKAGVRTVTVYGGMSAGRQVDLISRGAQVVVATPGRLLDLLKSGRLRNFNPTHVVLDEADEMLDMGFLDDIQEIFGFLPVERQTLLFSATMPEAIKKLAKRILKEPQFITITKSETTNKDIDQQYYVIEEYERDDATVRLIDAQEAKKTIIFCRMKKEVDRLATTLISHGYMAKGLHGDMEQRQREEVIKSFRPAKSISLSPPTWRHGDLTSATFPTSLTTISRLTRRAMSTGSAGRGVREKKVWRSHWSPRWSSVNFSGSRRASAPRSSCTIFQAWVT